MTESNKNKSTNIEEPKADEILKITFPMFIMSLSTSALMHMGEVKNPVTDKDDKDKNLAKQSIDIIDMLATKTKGNLDEEEDKLVQSILRELKLKFVSM